jgi:thermitase
MALRLIPGSSKTTWRSPMIYLRKVVSALGILALMIGGDARSQVLVRRGKTIELSPSNRLLALHLKNGIPRTANFTSAVAGTVVNVLSDTSILKSKGIVLIRTAEPNVQQHSTAHFTDAAGELGTILPVYRLGDKELIVTDEILIRPKDPGNHAFLAQLNTFGSIFPVGLGSYLLRLNPGKSTLDTSNELARNAAVDYSEPNFITLAHSSKIKATVPRVGGTTAPPFSPNDQLFPVQWFLENRGDSGTKAHADISAKGAWAASASGEGIIIAILDVGVDADHEDLKAKIVKPYDAIDDHAGETPNTLDAHGTACAGIAAASTNNKIGIAGVAPKASIMPIRVMETASNGDLVYTSDIIQRGISYAVTSGADVISSSWGGGGDDPHIDDAIMDGIAHGRRNHKGAIFVFAVGDDGGPVAWPASLAGSSPVIAVGATNEWDQVKSKNSNDNQNWWASNVGPEVTVVAPGVDITTTDISGKGGYVNGNYVSGFWGTSGSSPIVAGVAALILSREPTLTAAEVKQRLETSADTLGPKDQYGAGRVNACRAVKASNC